MMKRAYVSFLAVMVLSVLSRAAVIEMEMTGTITTVEDPLGLLPFAHPGGQMVYRFSYDSDAPDGAPSSDSLGLYTGLSATLRAGTQVLEVTTPPHIQILHPNDWFEVNSNLSNAGLSPHLWGGFFYSRLLDQAESNAIPNTQLPVSPYDLSAFANRSFQVFFRGPQKPGGSSEFYNFAFAGTVDTWTPEPLSLLLILPILGLRRFNSPCHRDPIPQ
jgi:hypothetical protein